MAGIVHGWQEACNAFGVQAQGERDLFRGVVVGPSRSSGMSSSRVFAYSPAGR